MLVRLESQTLRDSVPIPMMIASAVGAAPIHLGRLQEMVENHPGRWSISTNLFRKFFFKTHRKNVILSGAPHRFIASHSA
jgi:hypothetical protein